MLHSNVNNKKFCDHLILQVVDLLHEIDDAVKEVVLALEIFLHSVIL